jgi:hypothetical protein
MLRPQNPHSKHDQYKRPVLGMVLSSSIQPPKDPASRYAVSVSHVDNCKYLYAFLVSPSHVLKAMPIHKMISSIRGYPTK